MVEVTITYFIPVFFRLRFLRQLKDVISAKAMSDAIAEMEASGADPETVALAKKNLDEIRKRDDQLRAELQVSIAGRI